MLAFATQVVLGQRKAPTIYTDPQSYIGVAAGLLEHGVFAKAFVPAGQTPVPGRVYAPGYPASIAALAMLDPHLADGVRCLATLRGNCALASPVRSLIVVQALFGAAALAFAYFIARALSGSTGLATLTALLTFIMGRFAEFVGLIGPYGLLPALALAFCLALLMAHRRASTTLAALAGLILGALALFEIYYAALWLLAPLLFLWAERSRNKPRWGFAVRAAAVIVLATGLVIGPWMARNYVVFGDVALTGAGTETNDFAERVAYNSVHGRQLLIGMFYWLPGVGDLSGLFLPRDSTRKFDGYYEGSLLLEARRIINTSVPAPGETLYAHLFHNYVLADLASYAVTCLLMIERGLRATARQPAP